MPAFYVPARDSRHRVACIALYRALLRQVPHIALPNDLTTLARPGWTNPILYLVRSGFRRNKNDTSPRLVTSALKSGYRFLTLLTRAHETSSPQHGEIVAFLRDRQAKFPPAPPPPSQEDFKQQLEAGPKKTKPPVLTKVSPAGAHFPVYEPAVRPLPLAELSGGRRRVPNIELANGIPFLRIGKPQSHWLANYLRRRSMMRQKRITAKTDLEEATKSEARWEDEWESCIARQADEEGVELLAEDSHGSAAAIAVPVRAGRQSKHGGADLSTDWLHSIPSEFSMVKETKRTQPAADGLSFEKTLWEFGVRHVRTQLDEESRDILARAQAMVHLVREEKRLAEEEKAKKDASRRRAWEDRTRAEKAQLQDGQIQPTF